MLTRRTFTFAGSAVLAGLPAFHCRAAVFPVAKPEEVGLSSQRLRIVHDTLQRHIDDKDLSGAVAVIARKGRIAYFEALGLMDIESAKPMTRDALFRLASTSKPVTAAATLMLFEEGKLRLTDPVSRFIPEFKNATVAIARETPAVPGQPPRDPEFYTIPANRDITIRDLLTHTSGLASGGVTAREVAKLLQARKPTDTLADFIPRLAALPLDFQPGTMWRYSGLAGFDTLGRVVEIVSGLAFDQFLRQRMFEPLGMKDTFFSVPEDRLPRLVTLYRKTPEGLRKSENQRALTSRTYFSGAGGLISTGEDFLRFGQMLLNGGALDGQRLLGPRTVELMMSNNVGDLFNGQIRRPPQGMGFGLGGEVVLDTVASGIRRPNGSYGWDGAFGTHFWVAPKEQLVAVLMIQTPSSVVQRDYENAVMQDIVE